MNRLSAICIALIVMSAVGELHDLMEAVVQRREPLLSRGARRAALGHQ